MAMSAGAAWRHSILFRTVAVVVGIGFIVGSLFVARTAIVVDDRTRSQSTADLHALIDTVERTASIACFVKDQQLAKEVALGLLNNRSVRGIRIESDGQELVATGRDGMAAQLIGIREAPLRRILYSPFDRAQQVGEIQLYPNDAEIGQAVERDARFMALLLVLLVASLVIAIVLVLVHWIMRPIKGMSDALHSMDATTGDRLRLPRGHHRSELGQLAGDINRLADRLVATLDDERKLRVLREIDEKKYRAIFDTAETGIFIVNAEGAVESANPALRRQLGWPADVPLSNIEARMAALAWRDPKRPSALLAECLERNRTIAEDLEIADRDNRKRWLNVTLTPIGNGRAQGLVSDVTERKLAEYRAKLQAITDPLTGAANRPGFEQALQDAISRAETSRHCFTLMHLDLDGFKRINEALGLPVGDEILTITYQRLRDSLKPADTVARLGGDEFAVLLPGIDGEAIAASIAERLVRSLRELYDVNSIPIKLGASIGIALYPNDGQTMPTLLRHAELALDRANATGGNRYCFFDKSMAEAAERRRTMETDMQLALRRSEFELYFQPIVDLRVNRLVGAEALIRWHHQSRGMIPPDAFIPLAEESGLIVDIGHWALEAACRQLAIWGSNGHPWYLSLNISGRQIPDGLTPAALANALRRHGVEHTRLALEVTEGVLMKDVDLAQRWLGTIRETGSRIYLDDFGTGYSSLSYLKRFPVDVLKVDKSFVRDIHNDPGDRALVQAIIAMADSLGMEVVAEGVENREQLALLRRMNCRHAQGYYFSRAVPAREFDIIASTIDDLLDRP